MSNDRFKNMVQRTEEQIINDNKLVATDIAKLRDVTIGGGGAVTGVVVHPKDPDLVYVRTDVGGAYRWDPQNLCWHQLLYSMDKECRYGVAGICLDENNPDKVYVCVGAKNNLDSAVFVSNDRGVSWRDANAEARFEANAGITKKMGECIAVDPNNSDVVIIGTYGEAVKISSDGAYTWEKPNFGKGNEEVKCVVFDRRRVVDGKSAVLYASVYDGPLYRSLDAGKTWDILSGSPERVRNIRIADDGVLYITASTGLFRYFEGTYKDITPIFYKDGYRPLAVDPKNSNRIACSLHQNDWYMPIYYSCDGGKTWNDVSHGRVSHRCPNFGSWCFSASIGGLAFGKGDTLWMTDWYAVWRCDRLGDIREGYQQRMWEDPIKGIEELVTYAAATVPGDMSVITGSADSELFYFSGEVEDFKKFPVRVALNEDMAAGHTVDYCAAEKNFRITAMSQTEQAGDLKYSTNGGKTWKFVEGWDKKNLCYTAAVNSGDKDNISVISIRDTVRTTTDGGKTWFIPEGLPESVKKIIPHSWIGSRTLVSDKNKKDVFYLLSPEGFYKSEDGARSFKKTSDIKLPEQSWSAYIETIEGFEGEVWVSGSEGVWHSDDFGETFEQLEHLRAGSLSIGKGKTDDSYVVWYLGYIGDQKRALYYSEDKGKTLTKVIDIPVVQGKISRVFGDANRYLRAYMSTSGLGWKYIDIAEDRKENGK
ncbi:MAG: hypothetical protein J6K88_02740 [Oscillospiraceae bacterium]|nr:hypothetical protein [Oscillospiraceae bacterium]